MPVVTDSGHLFQTLEDGTILERGGRHISTVFLGEPGRESFPGPQAFLVNVPPTRELASHFHNCDQFQVMFAAPGAFYQRTPIARALLHYSDAYSVYGPFGAGPEDAFFYYTLRAIKSTLHGAMPEMRDQLAYIGERHFRIELQPRLDAPAPINGVAVETLFGPYPDGLAAYLVRFAPGAEAPPPAGELRTGRYAVGIEGEFEYDGRSFGPRSLGWSQGEIEDVTLTGGPTGAAVLFLHLPYPESPISHERASTHS